MDTNDFQLIWGGIIHELTTANNIFISSPLDLGKMENSRLFIPYMYGLDQVIKCYYCDMENTGRNLHKCQYCGGSLGEGYSLQGIYEGQKVWYR